MSQSPLRTAFLALITGLSLSLSLLAVGYFSGSTQAPPTASLGTIDESEYGTGTDDAPSVAAGPVETFGNNSPATDAGDPDSGRVDVPGSASIPVNVVSHLDGSGLAIGLEEALRPSSGRGEFHELPPPPEFEAPAVDTDPARIERELEELFGRVQTNFDGLHNEFDRLHVQFVGLQDRFAEELTAVRLAHGDLERTISDLAAATASRDQSPPPLACDVTVLSLPLLDAARHGALPLIARDARGITLSMLPVFASQTRWAISNVDSAALQTWLRDHGQARLRQNWTLRIEQQSISGIDLTGSLTPGMIQARGAQVSERTIALPWDGPLSIRASTTPSDLFLVEIRVESAPTDHGGWTSATVAPGDALILTVDLDEVQRPLAGTSPATGSSRQQAVGRQSAAVQMIVLLEPRLLTTPSAASHQNAGGLIPIPSDVSETR